MTNGRKREVSRHMKNKEDLLKEQLILKNIPSSTLAKLSQVATLNTFEPGEKLMYEEDKSNNIHFIIKGIVLVSNMLEDGTIVPITLLHEGQSVGEMGPITDRPRSATVEAISSVETLVVSRDNLKLIMQSDPILNGVFLNELSSRIRHENKIFLIQKTKHLPEKAWLLLQELSPYFENQSINLSHEKLAELIGVTRPRLTEALHILETEHKIQLSFNNIRVLKQ